MQKMGFAVLLSLLGSGTQAQNWCAPGAAWTYGMQAAWGEGYYELTYVSDTLLGGVIGQNINSQQHIFYHDVDSVVDGPSQYYVTTRRDTDMVWWWQPDSLAWDTLYWFGAMPGERWLPPNYVGMCPAYAWIEVVDTGTVIVSGVPLHYSDVMQAGEFDTLYSRITERLGWEWEMNIWPPCAIGPASVAQGLRCYSDVQVNWSDPDWNYGCNSNVGMEQREQTGKHLLFPNPGSDHFILDLPERPHIIELHDVAGGLVLKEQLTGGAVRVSTMMLAEGLYTYRVHSVDGTIEFRGKWIKE